MTITGPAQLAGTANNTAGFMDRRSLPESGSSLDPERGLPID